MTPDSLAFWIHSRGISNRTAAKVLDISGRRLRSFLDGKVRIPDHIQIACLAVSAGLHAITTTEKK